MTKSSSAVEHLTMFACVYLFDESTCNRWRVVLGWSTDIWVNVVWVNVVWVKVVWVNVVWVNVVWVNVVWVKCLFTCYKSKTVQNHVTC